MITAMAGQANRDDDVAKAARKAAETKRNKATEETREAGKREEMAHMELVESRAKDKAEQERRARIIEEVKSMEGGEDVIELMDFAYGQGVLGTNGNGNINGGGDGDDDDWISDNGDDDDFDNLNMPCEPVLRKKPTLKDLEEKRRQEGSLFSCW